MIVAAMTSVEHTNLWLLVDLAAILAAGLAAGLLFRRFGLPALVGELVAGVLLGPSLWGALSPATQTAVFPPEARPLLSALAHLGVVLFVFHVGAELRTTRSSGRLRADLCMAGSTFLLPFAAGVGVGLLLSRVVDVPASAWGFAVFVGLTCGVTAFPVLARLLEDLGERSTPLGVAALTASGMADIVVWIGATITVACAGVSSGGPALVIGGLAALAAVCLLVVRPLIEWVARAAPEGNEGWLSVLMIVVCLGSAAWSDAVGTDAVFGALISGLCMPGIALDRRRSGALERINVVGQILVPVFFVVLGFSIDLTALSRGEWAEFAVILLLVPTAKYTAVMLGGRLGGLERAMTRRLGIVMNCCGMTEIVVVGVGIHAGLVPARYTAFLVLLAITLTTMAAVVARWSPPLPPEPARPDGLDDGLDADLREMQPLTSPTRVIN